MVQKCCVRNCESSNDSPSHRIPYKNKEIWLQKIDRLDLMCKYNRNMILLIVTTCMIFVICKKEKCFQFIY